MSNNESNIENYENRNSKIMEKLEIIFENKTKLVIEKLDHDEEFPVIIKGVKMWITKKQARGIIHFLKNQL